MRFPRQLLTMTAKAHLPPRDPNNHPLKVINRINATENRPAYIAGPMVRYSKLPFRELVRHFAVDIVYTPMILAREFVRNQTARDSDFTTNEKDTPTIAQFGANNALDLVRAVELIKPYVDGIGLNCGCPIKEQVREGIGAALMESPEKVAEMVRAVKSAFGADFCVEVKIRIHKDLNDTVRYAQMVEAAGADYLTVHGRTKTQRSREAADFDAIRLVKQSVKIPVVANGDAFSLDDAHRIAEYTGCNGVMAVRGILSNPALFAGYKSTPWHAIEIFWDLVTAYGLPYRLTQHHLSEMLEGNVSKADKRDMNEQKNLAELIEWFDARFELRRFNEPGFGEDRSEYPWRKSAVKAAVSDEDKTAA